jgi:hypothetical protein
VPNFQERVACLVKELLDIWVWDDMALVFKQEFGVVHALCWFMMIQVLSHLNHGMEELNVVMPPNIFQVFQDKELCGAVSMIKVRHSRSFDPSGDRQMVSFADACVGTIKWIQASIRMKSSVAPVSLEIDGLFVYFRKDFFSSQRATEQPQEQRAWQMVYQMHAVVDRQLWQKIPHNVISDLALDFKLGRLTESFGRWSRYVFNLLLENAEDDGIGVNLVGNVLRQLLYLVKHCTHAQVPGGSDGPWTEDVAGRLDTISSFLSSRGLEIATGHIARVILEKTLVFITFTLDVCL